MTHTYPNHQKGAVLIVSLLLLLVLTVIGVTGLSNTSLEERMSGNFHHSMLAYQAAESALEKIIIASDPEVNENPFYVEADDPMIDATNAGIDSTDTVVADNFDANLNGTSLITATTVIYQGEKNCPDTSFGEIICAEIQARANATVAATNTSTIHVLGLQRPMPGNQNTKNIIN